MITAESFEKFTVYKDSSSNSFLYADFNNPSRFMEGLAEYILSEFNLLNYANTLTPIPFSPTPQIYNKLYRTLGSFLNSEMEALTFDRVSNEVKTVLAEEYAFIDINGETRVQKDKIGKIGEYVLHLLLTNYYKVHCIIPKFRCTTDRNMSVFGIDALFFDPATGGLYFGESKVCNTIDNAITLINRSFADYEEQISEEYKLVLSNDEAFKLSEEFLRAFQQHTAVCITFQDFLNVAGVKRIFVPAFLAHGNGDKDNDIEHFLNKMNTKLKKKRLFNLDTEYLFISLPIIDKAKILEVIMKKVVQKSNEYRDALSAN